MFYRYGSCRICSDQSWSKHIHDPYIDYDPDTDYDLNIYMIHILYYRRLAWALGQWSRDLARRLSRAARASHLTRSSQEGAKSNKYAKYVWESLAESLNRISLLDWKLDTWNTPEKRRESVWKRRRENRLFFLYVFVLSFILSFFLSFLLFVTSMYIITIIIHHHYYHYGVRCRSWHHRSGMSGILQSSAS